MATRLSREQRRKRTDEPCPMCHRPPALLWTCRCGFAICDDCMKKDMWGFSCNGLTWVCPDCGEVHSF